MRKKALIFNLVIVFTYNLILKIYIKPVVHYELSEIKVVHLIENQ